MFALYICSVIASSRMIIVRSLTNQEVQVSKSWRAVRVAFCWRKVSDPNYTSIYALFTRIHCLIGTWRTTQENSTTTKLYGSGLGWLIRWTICGVGVARLVVFGLVWWSRWRKLCLLRDCNCRDQHIHIRILWKSLVASLCSHTSGSVILCLASTCVVGFKVHQNFYVNCGESVQPLQSVKLIY